MSDDPPADNAAKTVEEARAIREETRILREEMQALLQMLEIYVAIAEAWRDSRLIKGGWFYPRADRSVGWAGQALTNYQ